MDARYAPINYITDYWFDGYSVYCSDLHDWATAIGCEADDIEFFLWKAANRQLTDPDAPYNVLLRNAMTHYDRL